MNEMTVYENNTGIAKKAISIQEVGQLMQIAECLGTCPFYQKIGKGGVLAIWMTAREFNLPPMMCLNGGLYTFDGKVSLSAQLMHMMLLNAHIDVKVIELTDVACEIHFKRPGQEKAFEYRFTIEMAVKAGYMAKDNWKKHTRDMLFNRCLSGGARKCAPDALMGAYSFGEIADSRGFDDSQMVNVMPEIAQQEVIKPVELINEEEYQILDDLIGEDADYRSNVESFLKRLNIESLDKLPKHELNRFMISAQANAAAKIEKIEEVSA